MPRTQTVPGLDGCWVYHVSASDQRDSILSTGLDHTSGTSAYEGMDYERGNYVFTDLGVATKYLHIREEEERNEYGMSAVPYDLYRVDGDGLDLAPDQFADDASGLGQFSRLVREPIKPGRITRYGVPVHT